MHSALLPRTRLGIYMFVRNDEGIFVLFLSVGHVYATLSAVRKGGA